MFLHLVLFYAIYSIFQVTLFITMLKILNLKNEINSKYQKLFI